MVQEIFIKKAKLIHGDKYDYSLVEYVNNKTLIKIICQTHGVFLQRPDGHLNGKGCKLCGFERSANSKRNDSGNFINTAKLIHGDKYDYSLVEYVNNSTNVLIICPIHGEFSQKPSNHLSGRECFKCSIDSRKKKRSLTTNDFIEKAKKKHHNKYDYSLVNYINGKSNIQIICNKHGVFIQRAESHLTGVGCPKCSTNFKLTSESFIERSNLIHNNKYKYDKFNYVNNKTKSIIICKEHGEFQQRPNDHLSGHGCPTCLASNLERIVRNFLIANNINFIPQYNAKWLDRQTLDFYLSDYNIGIECQGVQHYKPIDVFGGDNEFKITQKRDKLKKEKCEKNCVALKYIKYDDNIIEKLNQIIDRVLIS